MSDLVEITRVYAYCHCVCCCNTVLTGYQSDVIRPGEVVKKFQDNMAESSPPDQEEKMDVDQDQMEVKPMKTCNTR